MADPHIPAASPSWRLSLVIPAYNEASGIARAIVEADTALSQLAADYEILVVDDGSTDSTAAVVQEMLRHHPRVRLLRHAVNRGYSAALRTGFEAACFDRIAFTDADCQFDLADLARLVPLMDHYPVVVGYRRHRQDSWRRRFLSWGYNTLVRALLGTGVRDCDCALKVFRKDALLRLLPETPGFFANTEMLTRARQEGFRIAEVGVRHRPRLHGSSKVSLKHIPCILKTLLPFWWSQVLFPVDRLGNQVSPVPDTSPQPMARYVRAASFLLVVAAAFLFFCRLGCPLQEPQEPRYAEIPRQMLAAGEWIVPLLHGQPYYDKPPLLYWSVMLSYRLFGVHDWAARLVPSGAAFLTVLLTYYWGRRTIGPRAALAGALMLCLSARFIYLGRLLTMDSLLCLWVTGALALAHSALGSTHFRWRWWLSSAAACGLGLLTKGPIALVLVLPPLLALMLLDRRLTRPGWRGWVAYLTLAVGLASPWYVALGWTDSVALSEFFLKHNILRFLAPWDHEEPPWFYLPGLFLGMLPWTLLVPGFLRFLTRHSRKVERQRPAALGFFLLSFLWCLLFYSVAGCKRAVYILPALPPLALSLGCYLDILLPQNLGASLGSIGARRGAVLAYRATLLMLLIGVGTGLAAGIAGLWTPATSGIVIALGLAGLAMLYRPNPSYRPWGAWTLCAGITFILLLGGVHQLLPCYARKFSLRGQIRPLANSPEDARLPVICYPRRWDSVSFYLQRQDIDVYTPDRRGPLIQTLREHARTLVFIKAIAVEDFLHTLPPSLEFIPCGRQGPLRVGYVCWRQEAPPVLYASR